MWPTSSGIDKEFNHDGHGGFRGHPENMDKEDSDTKRHVIIGAASIGTPHPTPVEPCPLDVILTSHRHIHRPLRPRLANLAHNPRPQEE